MHPLTESVQLLFQGELVGVVSNVNWHQGTWFGTLIQSVDQPHVAVRVREFAAFCESFHARSAGPNPPNPAEFDQFKDLFVSGSWRIRADEPGMEYALDGAPPFFFSLREVSWFDEDLSPA